MGNDKKSVQLGMSWSAASRKLHKQVLLSLLKKYDENICHRCGEPIETERELSLEHKEPWLDVNPALFWDLDNIAWSHLSCNVRASRPASTDHFTYEMRSVGFKEYHRNHDCSLTHGLTKEQQVKGSCARWNISQGKPCVCGTH